MKTPVVFLVFNRPEFTHRVFARIREARPEKLIVIADGPRADRVGEAEKCRQVRELIDSGIDWPCDTVRDYAQTNLGCGRRVASGITNAFNLVEEAIVLEDDCLPDRTFFPFCEELLHRYRDNMKIAAIGGSNHQYCPRTRDGSYYFSHYNHIWGWASWRRAWRLYDFEMKEWPCWEKNGGIKRMFSALPVRRHFSHLMDFAYRGRIDTWDVQWTFACWLHQLKSILPAVSLVENIGFSPNATHTTLAPKLGIDVKPMKFPLRHPESDSIDFEADAHTEAAEYSRPVFWRRVAFRAMQLWRPN